MSSGKIKMSFTYTKNKSYQQPQPQPPQPEPPQQPPPANRAKKTPMNRMKSYANISMYHILHTPANGCSSCGN
jgi:hypothetical protein